MGNIKSQAGNKTQYQSKNYLRRQCHPAFDRLQSDGAILRQDRAVSLLVKPYTQTAFSFCDEVFGFLPAHFR
jgi:hypothetical protein